MKIEHIGIKNVFQHGSLEISTDGNLIGLIGPNGSGKSNLLKCIQFAFSGEVPGKVKEQFLKWGEKSGSVTVRFTHQGRPGVITRATGQGKTSLEYNDETYTGITKVNNAVDALLGMDKDVARTVFVPQAELDAVLFETPAKREQAFQRMCGIGEADKIQDALGKWVNAKMPPVFDTSAQIAEGKAEYAQLETTESELAEELATTEQKLQELDLDSLRVEQQVLTDTQNHCNTVNTLEAEVLERAARESALQQQLAEARSQIDGISFEKLDEKLRTAEQSLALAEEYDRLSATRAAKAQELDALGECPVTSEDVEKALEAAQAASRAVSELQGVSKMYTSLLGALEAADASISECPVCGSGITDKTSVIARLQAFVSESGAKVAALGVPALETAYRTARATYDGFSSKKQNLQGQLASVDERLSVQPTPQSETAQLRATLTGMKQVAASLRQAQVTAAGLEAQVNAERAEMTSIRKRIDTAKERLVSLGCTRDDFHAELREACAASIENGRRITECTLLMQQQAGLKGRLGEIRSRMAALASGLEKMSRQNEQTADYEATKKTLEQVRSWLHYSNGPHKLAVKVMEALTSEVNMFLTKLNAPFYVVLDDDGMSYRCPFTDGRTMPETGAPDASELSGGQKALLAISFRLASYCMFASRQGLMCLDEVTAYLDSENVSNFCTLLERLKEIMAQLDLQVLLSTHEQQVLPFMDSVVNLYDKESLAA